MFTGIIEHLGRVVRFDLKEDGGVLKLEAENLFQEVNNGDSVAVNGVCLTVIEHDGNQAVFELGPQTLEKTNLFELQQGHTVNLELPLRLQDRLGGHFVQGHVDATGEIVKIEKKGDTDWLEVEVPQAFVHYLIPQGSLAIDGISLTIAQLEGGRVGIMLMDYTMKKTNLSQRKVGDKLNLEFDMLAKMVSAMLKNEQ